MNGDRGLGMYVGTRRLTRHSFTLLLFKLSFNFPLFGERKTAFWSLQKVPVLRTVLQKRFCHQNMCTLFLIFLVLFNCF